MNDLTITKPGALPAPAAEATQIMTKIMELASAPDVNPEMFDRLVALQEREQDRQARLEFNLDYMSARLEMPKVRKDGVVEYAVNKSQPDGPKKEAFRFATIENIEDVVAPIERKYGFSHLYDSAPRAGDGGGITATITLIHKSGHEKTSSFSAGLDTSGGKSNLQGMHSSYSLAKRVALMAIWGIVYEGKDDGGVAGGLKYITDAEKEQLVELLRETKSNTAAFLQRVGGVNSVDEIEHKNFPAALNLLLSKKAGMPK
jgi:hypothetical protein